MMMTHLSNAQLTHGSLFSGIGTFDLACETHGIKNIFACDKSLFSEIHFITKHPEVKFYPDIKEIESLPYVDIISFGSPCQDASNAATIKKTNPLEHERSGLFYEAIRVIQLSMPRYIIFENVAAMRTKGGYDILTAFHHTGYDTEERILQADWFGALHQRKRWFVIGTKVSDSNRIGRHTANKILGKVTNEVSYKEADTLDWIQKPQSIRDVCVCDWREANRGGISDADGFSEGLLLGHLAKSLGNAIFYPLASAIIREIINHHNQTPTQ